jgi:hypothetical protein
VRPLTIAGLDGQSLKYHETAAPKPLLARAEPTISIRGQHEVWARFPRVKDMIRVILISAIV